MIKLFYVKNGSKKLHSTKEFQPDIENPQAALTIVEKVRKSKDFRQFYPSLAIQLGEGDPDKAEQWRTTIALGGK